MKKAWSWAIGGLLGVASLPMVWLLVGNWVATRQEQRSQQQWQAFTASLAQPTANSKALEIEKLAAQLGINILGIAVANRPQPTPSQRQEFEAIRKQLQDFLDRQFEQDRDGLEPLPRSLHRYLDAHAAELMAIRSQLLAGELPRWEWDLTQPTISQRSPSFAGLVSLQRLLILQALEQQRSGQQQQAIATWEASWKLNQAIRDTPEFSSQITALIVSKIQAGGLRKMRDLPAVWQQRLLEHDYRVSFLNALNRETWWVTDFIRQSGSTAKTFGPLSWAQWNRWLRQPYFRLAALDAGMKMRQAYLQLPDQNVCTFDPFAFDQHLDASLAAWNQESSEVMFGFVHQWRTAGQLMVDLELTQQILQLRQKLGSQSALSEQQTASQVCANAQWQYRWTADDQLAIAFDQPLVRPPQAGIGLVLPLTYHLQWKNSGSFQEHRLTPQ